MARAPPSTRPGPSSVGLLRRAVFGQVALASMAAKMVRMVREMEWMSFCKHEPAHTRLSESLLRVAVCSHYRPGTQKALVRAQLHRGTSIEQLHHSNPLEGPCQRPDVDCHPFL